MTSAHRKSERTRVNRTLHATDLLRESIIETDMTITLFSL